MAQDITDAGLVKAFMPKPSCANCPCSTRESGQLACTRYPPEMHLVTRQSAVRLVSVPQVGFKPVRDDMVCWEHPAMQVRMEQAILAARQRSRAASHGQRMPDGSYQGPMTGADLSVMRPGSATEHYDPFQPKPRPAPIESAAGQEGDGRKPGDET